MAFQFGQNSQAAPQTAPQAVVPQVAAPQVASPSVGSGVFSGVGQAKPPMQSNYCSVGQYLAQIVKAHVKQNRKREPGAIVEMRICHVLDNAQGRGHLVGDDVTWYCKVSNEYFLGEARMLVANSVGAPFESIDEATCNRVFSDENPLAGCFVEWKGSEVPTKAGGLFTKIKFIRNIPAVEIKQNMDPTVVVRMFPNGALDQLIANEG